MVRSIWVQSWLSWRLIINYFSSSFSFFQWFKKKYRSYKQKCVQKVLPNLSLPRKSVVRLTDHLDMAMTVDWDLKSQTKESQNSSRGQSYLYSMVSNPSKHKSRCGGATVVEPLWWSCCGEVDKITALQTRVRRFDLRLHQSVRWDFNRFKPSSEYFTDRSMAVVLLWIVFVSDALCWCLLCCRDCSL